MSANVASVQMYCSDRWLRPMSQVSICRSIQTFPASSCQSLHASTLPVSCGRVLSSAAPPFGRRFIDSRRAMMRFFSSLSLTCSKAVGSMVPSQSSSSESMSVLGPGMANTAAVSGCTDPAA
eukprot:TRINITY_DN11193_c0_g1_i2.p2 TRINITY_DN11193_c0_g1~~TRINITY_DN11193_c0_g1_i2.p2  ORF type:complete len:122 (-),score=10.29 TRINITY_DN11193_c0_g1_i2:29-394(-)